MGRHEVNLCEPQFDYHRANTCAWSCHGARSVITFILRTWQTAWADAPSGERNALNRTDIGGVLLVRLTPTVGAQVPILLEAECLVSHILGGARFESRPGNHTILAEHFYVFCSVFPSK
jgi:hypothetical protein